MSAINEIKDNNALPEERTGPGHPPNFHILVNHKPHQWPQSVISGTEIKKLAGMEGDDYDAWRVMGGKAEDELVGDQNPVTLSEPGVEKFLVLKAATTEG